ncbi:methyltransferase-like protein 22 [Myripristis murdjan]|uniref:Methyltransferase 22, Kin17 lysine n=1 Tax=Myripristis murdjan TaxID=586833 RepID=A0A668AGG1_9TELE|nr:methyltransferase-like protein 22 [Myripristis murdjan]
MDRITFQHDTVLSEIHLLLPNARHLMARLNRVGQPVFISKFRILWDGESKDDDSAAKGVEEKEVRSGGDENETKANEKATGQEDVDPVLDEDGDLMVTRRPRKSIPEASDRDKVCPVILSQSSTVLQEDEEEEEEGQNEHRQCCKDIITIEHTMATPLEDVGKQVWRGAFLLADFILSHPVKFRGATVLELGGGTGLTSIAIATVAKTVYCTDIGEDLLCMCQRNITLNQNLLEPAGGEVRVRQLDWLQHDLCTDADVEFSWTEEEVADLYDNTSVIIAADVCYDDDLTDGFFRTLYHLCCNFSQPCVTYLSIEKRMNFTLRHMNVSCEAYNYFCRCLSQLQDLTDGRCTFRVEQVPTTFPQSLQYERIEQLELWKVTATPSQFNQVGSDSELFPS